MKFPRRLALLSALALAGCISTSDEPFSLDDGDAAPAAAGGYVCASYDAAGNRVVETHEGRLIPLRRNKQTQYVFVADETKSEIAVHASSGEGKPVHRRRGALGGSRRGLLCRGVQERG